MIVSSSTALQAQQSDVDPRAEMLQDLPDRSTRAAINAAEEEDLQVALSDPVDHPTLDSATRPAVGEGG